MDALILVIHVVISLLLIGLILIQHGKGADAGAALAAAVVAVLPPACLAARALLLF